MSGERLVYLDPQKKIWPGHPGQCYDLKSLKGTDMLVPFNGIEGFDYHKTTNYPRTLFRFPLRNKVSDLSDNTYDVESLSKLIDQMKDEANFLLLFLRSVHTVEVYDIPQLERGNYKLCFSIKVAPKYQNVVACHREDFLTKLKKQHSLNPFKISNVITDVVPFEIQIKFNDTAEAGLQGEQSVSWLVSSQVGSSKKQVLEAAAKQQVFPWVGVAMQLDPSPTSSAHDVSVEGRVFCFLPMPVETSSGLPVYVNGTFGLNDDRRTIKWPARERRNDPSAQWNQMLVTDCLPSCYNFLLRSAIESNLISFEFFYRAWPDIDILVHSNWKLLLDPLFTELLKWECLLAQRIHKRVRVKQAVVNPECEQLPEVVKRVLTNLKLPLCDVPKHVFEAIQCKHNDEICQVSPSFLCSKIHNRLQSYSVEQYQDKLKLLHYCLSDDNCINLSGLELLPMANESFNPFGRSTAYLCSDEFPRKLLPNLGHKLVDLRKIDEALHRKLIEIAGSGFATTLKLKCLSASVVANLLLQCYPPKWNNKEIVQVSGGDQAFSFEWCEFFWRWAQSFDLSLFTNNLLVPLVTTDDCHTMNLTRLRSKSAVVLIESNNFPTILVEAFAKLGIKCTILKYVPFLQHKQRLNFFCSCDPSGILTAMSRSAVDIQNIQLSFTEATQLQMFLASQKFDLNTSQVRVLQRLCIFHVINHSNPLSLLDASEKSWKRKVVLPPDEFCFTDESLPSNLPVLSSKYNQHLLIQACRSLILSPDSIMSFLLDILFPMIQKNICPSDKVEKLMVQVLKYFPVLKRKERAEEFKSKVANLNFIPIDDRKIHLKASNELFEHSDCLKNLFHGKPVFPGSPFDVEEMLLPLKECGLRTEVSGKDLLGIIDSFECARSEKPQIVTREKIMQAKAVLAYIQEHPDVLNLSAPTKLNPSCLLHEALRMPHISRSWLPVLISPPHDYPQPLAWKSNKFLHHLVSFNSFVLFSKTDDISHASSLVGSQMYIVECSDSLVKALGREIPISHVLQHLIHMVNKVKTLENSHLNILVHKIYKFLDEHLIQLKLHHSTSTLQNQKLVWMKKQHEFAVPDQFVLNEHPSFHYNLLPFYQVLPESLCEYSKLFAHFGVHHELTNSFIIRVLEKIMKGTDNVVLSPEVAWEIVTNILNWLTNRGQTPAKEKLTDCDVLYVPIVSDKRTDRPQLASVNDVVYTDLEFLKSFEASKGDAPFIHERFLHLAELLGVQRLSAHWDISHDAFGDVGPHEPLVTRLKNILKDYKDGITIIKELIQNADDARATEVNICYDGRTHSAQPGSLLFPGMSKCHGPALLVHNNATFSDKDFENITKLAGATKLDEPLKIGQFGVGFCSVYHITDIPSFISGDWLYIFDPAILFLEKEINNPAKPGKKLKFTERVVQHSEQLTPYKDLFGFSQEKFYQGTMFRFPFRTSQSENSISNILYNKRHIQELVADIKKAGSKLLLFLNHVKRLTFSWIDENDNEPTTIKLFSLERKFVPIVGGCDVQQISIYDRELQGSSKEFWLTECEKGSITYHRDKSQKMGKACVACRLQSSPKTYIPKTIEGEVFCFLPLSLQTGLPVHVSANFAVLSDRNGIHISDSGSPNEEVQWNIQLCKTLIPKAYFSMLNSLQKLCVAAHISVNDYTFHGMWPLKHQLKAQNPWKYVIDSLYQLIQSSTLFYSDCTASWLELRKSRLLSEDILQTERVNQAGECIVAVVKELDIPVIDLPSPYQEYFFKPIIIARTIHEQEFIDNFFKELHLISSEVRNKVLFKIFRVYTTKKDKQTFLKKHLLKEKCVPCTPNGIHLKRCSEIVDPSAYFADLYDETDGVFPFDEFQNDKLIHIALSELNIITSILPWHMIVQRANTIPLLFSRDDTKLKSMRRSSLVLKCIGDQITCSHESQFNSEQLTNIAFIPVLKRPQDYPNCLKWSGDNQSLFVSKSLLQGNKNIMLAGSQVCIVMEADPKEGGCGPVTQPVADALGIKQSPSCEVVVNHLLHIVDMYVHKEMNESTKAWVKSACEEIYCYLDTMLSRRLMSHQVVKKFCDNQSIWTGTTFVSTSAIAKSWTHSGPYLYAIPHILESRKNLIDALQIQSDFKLDHFLSALEQIYTDYDGKPVVDQDVFRIIAGISSELVGNIESRNNSVSLGNDQVCYLPDTDKVMHKTSVLALNETPWVEIDQDSFHVHQIIHRRVALQLGVTAVRSKFLHSYTDVSTNHCKSSEGSGKPFGQHEEITQRIRNILCEYPRDITLLKELLQNADDAKATKMYIILDKRRHGTKKVLSQEWKDLQGPALLVWNDSGMTEKDLKGIQELGIGGKRSDASAIGKFGIGFCVVYHITDCPSFLTNSNTLGILDPQCQYVPKASIQRPGWQFDGLDEQFWSNFSDMKSTYLLDDMSQAFNYPCEVQNRGTLFRFPLRHSQKLVKKSKLVEKDDISRFGDSCKPLSAWQLENYLNDWAPKIKEALLFLNHVRDIKFFTIDENNSVINLTHHYELLHPNEANAIAHKEFLVKVKQTAAMNQGSEITHYQVSLIEAAPKQIQEDWLIQQGMGDIQNQQQKWQHLPIHGLAAQRSKHHFVSKVFTFLPLPLESRLPVHINGNFFLDAARSGLWQCRDPSQSDDRQKWNLMLIESIASSYVHFLVSHQEHFISCTPYRTLSEVNSAVKNYYHLFPMWRVKDKPEREMLTLAEKIYKKLSENNSTVIAVISKHSGSELKDIRDSFYTVQWLSLTNKEQPFRQPYFWKKPDKEEHDGLPSVLKLIGVQLTDAPMHIQKHFSDIKTTLPVATPEQMFEYYCSYYIYMSDGWPCPIAETKFESVTNFIKFVKYIIQEKHFENRTGQYFMFPKQPIGIPLCLTADEMLHPFSENDKVICSKFSHLFPNCKEKFIHPDMYKLKLIPDYFTEPSEKNMELIHTVFQKSLPECLKMKERISNASKYINIRDLLIPLWHCFRTENIFQIHLMDIIKEWPLLLSKGNELFSCKSLDQLLPVIPLKKPSSDQQLLPAKYSPANLFADNSSSKLNDEVFRLLEKAGMPILDIEVVSSPLCVKFCPQMDQPTSILRNVYYLYQSSELKLLEDKAFDRKIAKLFTYFGAINFSNDQDSLSKVKSLPFFKNIDNSYNSMTGDTYVWPSYICLSGKNVWMDALKTTPVVFLKSDGVWSKLGAAETLGIKVLSPWSLYTKFIFPHFHLLSKEDRMKHLEHIRNTAELFKSAHYESKAETDSERKRDAVSFVNALKELPCILKNGKFRTVSSFCHPCVQLFKEFPHIYEFPPKELMDDKWLEFFSKVGLKVNIEQEEFVTLCTEVADRYHKNPSKASQALLKCLFDVHDWHKDDAFLEEVSKIPFVCAERLKQLSSIASAVKKVSEETVCLTSLNEAASKEIDSLIWTVMPVVKLPYLSYTSSNGADIPPWELKKMREKFYKKLHICKTPSCRKVVKNLLNISHSNYTKFNLLDTYDEHIHQRGKGKLLFEVIAKCFDFLSTNQCSEKDLLPLVGASCIPVSCSGDTNEVHRPVLVSAYQVVADRTELVKDLVPFLNPLPEALYSALPKVLSAIRVNQEVQFDNVRCALHIMHKHIKQPLDLNTRKKVRKLLKCLYHWLCRSGNIDHEDEALYLPNDHSQLIDSTKLLYNDKENYKQITLKYKFMSLLVDEFEERNEYGFCLKEFHERLPLSVRPQTLSKHCIERLSKQSKIQPELTDIAAKLKQAFNLQNFSAITVRIIKGFLNQNTPSVECKEFEEALSRFHQSVQVLTVDNLVIDVFHAFNSEQHPTPIGIAMVDFLLTSTSEDSSFSLYIDSDVDGLTLGLFESLSENIISVILAQLGNKVTFRDPFVEHAKKAIQFLLKGPSPDQLKKHLNSLGLNTIGLQLYTKIDPDFNPKLGQPIPREMYHRLQSDMHNIFRSHEWVGYEDKENHIVFARVEFQVEKYHDTQEEQRESEEEEDWDDSHGELDSYSIITSENLEETARKEVTVIELYKILRMKQRDDGDEEGEMVLYDPSSVGVQQCDAVNDENLDSIMVNICKDLKLIWRLTDEYLKTTAIKSMCLKLQTDRKTNPLLSEAYQFLQHQVKRLAAGQTLENPHQRETHDVSDIPNPTLDQLFINVDRSVSAINESWENEKSYVRKNPDTVNPVDNAIMKRESSPDSSKAKVWFKQAKHDLEALNVLFKSSLPNLYAHVCFMANQVAEKALRAGMYELIGLDEMYDLKHHKLICFAQKIEATWKQHKLEEMASWLEVYYVQARYPNQWLDSDKSHLVPSEQYTYEDAVKAQHMAVKIVEIIGCLVKI